MKGVRLGVVFSAGKYDAETDRLSKKTCFDVFVEYELANKDEVVPDPEFQTVVLGTDICIGAIENT